MSLVFFLALLSLIKMVSMINCCVSINISFLTRCLLILFIMIAFNISHNLNRHVIVPVIRGIVYCWRSSWEKKLLPWLKKMEFDRDWLRGLSSSAIRW